jgi:endonuclease YncB( thermonuclease family)
MKRVLAAGALLIAVLVCGGFVAAEIAGVSVPVALSHTLAPPEQGVVTAVVDGATLEVRAGDRVNRVRLEGLQIPTVAAPDRPGQCLGPEAGAILGGVAPVGSELHLVHRRDAAGRPVVRAYTGHGLLVNGEVVRLGFAQVVPSDDGPFTAELRRAAEEATTERRGLHSPAIGCTAAGQVQNVLTLVAGVPEAGPPGAPGVELNALASTATDVRVTTDDLVWSFGQDRTDPTWSVLEPAERADLTTRLRTASDQVAAREIALRAAASAAFSDEATRTAVQTEVNREAQRLAKIRKAEADRLAAIRRARAAQQAAVLRQALEEARSRRSGGSEGSSRR